MQPSEFGLQVRLPQTVRFNDLHNSKVDCDAGVTHLQAFRQENDDLRRPISLRKTAIIEAPGLAQEANDFEANNFRVADDTLGVRGGTAIASTNSFTSNSPPEVFRLSRMPIKIEGPAIEVRHPLVIFMHFW